jgi:hypothetical protein
VMGEKGQAREDLDRRLQGGGEQQQRGQRPLPPGSASAAGRFGSRTHKRPRAQCPGLIA